MADNSGGTAETVFCHECQNRWTKIGDDVTCPRCHSDFIEVLEPNSESEEPSSFESPRLPQSPRSPQDDPFHNHAIHHHPFNPFDHHNPWDGNPNVTRYEIRSGPGTTFTFTSASVRPGQGGAWRSVRRPYPDPAVAEVHNNFQQMLGNILGPRSPRSPGSRIGGGNYMRPGLDDPDPFTNFLVRNPYTNTQRFGPQRPGPEAAGPDINGLLGMLLGYTNGMGPPRAGTSGQDPNSPPHPFALLSNLFNPANVRAGDAVFTQEALDRVISQLMEQHASGNAPGPASADAIQALPKRQIDKEMVDTDGTAECSICMDAVELGSEVTELPCKHWFHGDCVIAWLREHDTCPHCRQSITPLNQNQHNQSQPPPTQDYSQASGSNSRQSSYSNLDGSRVGRRSRSDISIPGAYPRNSIYVPNNAPALEPSSSRRSQRHERHDNSSSNSRRHDADRDMRRSSSRNSTSGGGGVTGWLRNRFSGGN